MCGVPTVCRYLLGTYAEPLQPYVHLHRIINDVSPPYRQGPRLVLLLAMTVEDYLFIGPTAKPPGPPWHLPRYLFLVRPTVGSCARWSGGARCASQFTGIRAIPEYNINPGYSTSVQVGTCRCQLVQAPGGDHSDDDSFQPTGRSA